MIYATYYQGLGIGSAELVTTTRTFIVPCTGAEPQCVATYFQEPVTDSGAWGGTGKVYYPGIKPIALSSPYVFDNGEFIVEACSWWPGFKYYGDGFRWTIRLIYNNIDYGTIIGHRFNPFKWTTQVGEISLGFPASSSISNCSPQITAIIPPCISDWTCNQPYDGTEGDSCGHTRTNISCNACCDGAIVYLDTKQVGEVGSTGVIELNELIEGNHILKIEKEGFETNEVFFRVPGTTALNIKLIRL